MSIICLYICIAFLSNNPVSMNTFHIFLHSVQRLLYDHHPENEANGIVSTVASLINQTNISANPVLLKTSTGFLFYPVFNL